MSKKKELSVKESRADALEEIKSYEWDKPVDIRSLQTRMESILKNHKVTEVWVRSTFKHLAEYNGWELPKKPRKRNLMGWRLELVECALEHIVDIDTVIERVSHHVKTTKTAEEYVGDFYPYFQAAVKGL